MITDHLLPQQFLFEQQRLMDSMEYIFKPDLLDFSNHKHVDFQYFRWNEKKRFDKEKNQYEQFRKMWFQIEEDQSKEKQKQNKKTTKTMQERTKTTTCKPEETYNKNMAWKHNVENKIERQRQELREQQQKKETEALQEGRLREKKMFRDNEHQGPIKAWKERFDNYIKGKSADDEQYFDQNQFKPTIDKNSRRITSRMVGKVQDRLMFYGEKLKEKKAEMEANYEQQLQQKRNPPNAEFQSIQSDLSDVFWRLYKDGEKINKKRNTFKSEYSFTPQINQYSNELASRITEKRKPLYQIKNDCNSYENLQKSKLRDPRTKEKGFSDFLKRNEVLLGKIEKHKMKKIEEVKEKQAKQIKQCTFTPNLNPKSLKMFAHRQNEYVQPTRFQVIAARMPGQQVENKKLLMVRSQNGNINSPEKQINSTERIERLNSAGNMLHGMNPVYIGQQDSISNDFKQEEERISEQPHDFGRSFNRSRESREMDEFLPTDRYQKTEIYNINEEMGEEDSIEREKDNEWENELFKMERQIEEMMSRSPN